MNAGGLFLGVFERFQSGKASPMPSVEAERKKKLLAFQKSLSVKFKSIELLNLAFIHKSVANETGYRFNNEKLEFLGDAILGAVTVTFLYEKFSEKTEGELAKIKSAVVSADVLAGVSRKLRINEMLLLGRGEELSGGREKNALLADALEALIGAIYLDAGYKEVFSFVSRSISPEINEVVECGRYQDYKSLLQEFSQRQFKAYPVYHLLKCSGAEHERTFLVDVLVGGKTFGPCKGKNKKSAEQEAAKVAYEDFFTKNEKYS